MKRLLQAIPLHRWREGKWGHSASLDCRRCRLCGRFEIVGYGDWHRTDQGNVPDAVLRKPAQWGGS